MVHAIQRTYGGACLQMKLSYGHLAPVVFVFLLQWMDCLGLRASELSTDPSNTCMHARLKLGSTIKYRARACRAIHQAAIRAVFTSIHRLLQCHRPSPASSSFSRIREFIFPLDTRSASCLRSSGARESSEGLFKLELDKLSSSTSRSHEFDKIDSSSLLPSQARANSQVGLTRLHP
ncbi:hypothetical protein IEQ34_021985 [Dendrobium chrysotoxum]|uniref:Uncharacterized protein n=1 Tax=Dendrobium chrysotoxum TaxID=161865 RepID=A0AAV7FJY4_DENCH|nr:hypothetical protein IEQ34_021985 [Dendrobium chrysotoxum]